MGVWILRMHLWDGGNSDKELVLFYLFAVTVVVVKTDYK